MQHVNGFTGDGFNSSPFHHCHLSLVLELPTKQQVIFFLVCLSPLFYLQTLYRVECYDLAEQSD